MILLCFQPNILASCCTESSIFFRAASMTLTATGIPKYFIYNVIEYAYLNVNTSYVPLYDALKTTPKLPRPRQFVPVLFLEIASKNRCCAGESIDNTWQGTDNILFIYSNRERMKRTKSKMSS